MPILGILGGLATAIGFGKTIYEGVSSYGRAKYENKQLKNWTKKSEESIAVVKQNQLAQRDLHDKTRELQRQNFDIQQSISRAESLGGYGADTLISMNDAIESARRLADAEAALNYKTEMLKTYAKEDEIKMSREKSNRGFFADFFDAFVL